MAVFLTGATGYLGQSLVRVLRARGKEVRALVRPESSANGLDVERIEVFSGDVRNEGAVRAAMTGCRAVIHCSALTAASGRRRDFEETNVRGFRNVMDAAYRLKVPIVLSVSCFLALGPTFGTIGDEDHLSDDRRGAGPYEESLRVAERLTRSYVSGGLPLIVVYPGLVYGPGPVRGGNLLSRFIIARAKGKASSVPAAEDQRMSFCYIEDVAEGICRALERGVPGDRFLLAGHNVSFPRLFRLFEEISGLHPPRPVRNLVTAGARARFAEWGARLSGREPLRSRFVLDLMQNDWAYRSECAENELGYTNRPLEEGLKQTLDFLVREGHLA